MEIAEQVQALKDLNIAFEEYKSVNDEALALMVKKGEIDPILTEKIDKLNETIEAKTVIVEETKDRLEALETAAERSPAPPAPPPSVRATPLRSGRWISGSTSRIRPWPCSLLVF